MVRVSSHSLIGTIYSSPLSPFPSHTRHASFPSGFGLSHRVSLYVDLYAFLRLLSSSFSQSYSLCILSFSFSLPFFHHWRWPILSPFILLMPQVICVPFALCKPTSTIPVHIPSLFFQSCYPPRISCLGRFIFVPAFRHVYLPLSFTPKPQSTFEFPIYVCRSNLLNHT